MDLRDHDLLLAVLRLHGQSMPVHHDHGDGRTEERDYRFRRRHVSIRAQRDSIFQTQLDDRTEYQLRRYLRLE